MNMRDLSDVEVEASRQKGIDDALKIVNAFPEGLSTDQKLHALCERFRLCADRCFKPMMDNFHPRKYFERGNHEKGADLRIILLGAFKAASEMDEINRQMDILARNKMNGHTKPYLHQKEECDAAHYRLQIAKDLFRTNGANLRPSFSEAVGITVAVAAFRIKSFLRRNAPFAYHS